MSNFRKYISTLIPENVLGEKIGETMTRIYLKSAIKKLENGMVAFPSNEKEYENSLWTAFSGELNECIESQKKLREISEVELCWSKQISNKILLQITLVNKRIGEVIKICGNK